MTLTKAKGNKKHGYTMKVVLITVISFGTQYDKCNSSRHFHTVESCKVRLTPALHGAVLEIVKCLLPAPSQQPSVSLIEDQRFCLALFFQAP